ncbi:MAG: type II toxin-antitoxin system VapC family toxin [Deltaproteobacteria bacterium]|nr:type II toxin-antitoxin system VapC family toxin [Deltaproteobacteria bacterium]MBI4373629.1 type II toxin-antitoxin system VapC family toxin [Deltaproteobacteria bacterium]
MNLVDSSGWIEYFLDNPLASKFEKFIHQPESLIIPTTVSFEVYRHLLRNVDEKEVLFAVTQMEKADVIPLSQELAIYAAELSLKHNLATADSIIYATALMHEATLVTLDNDFRKLPGCEVIG